MTEGDKRVSKTHVTIEIFIQYNITGVIMPSIPNEIHKYYDNSHNKYKLWNKFIMAIEKYQT